MIVHRIASDLVTKQCVWVTYKNGKMFEPLTSVELSGFYSQKYSHEVKK